MNDMGTCWSESAGTVTLDIGPKPLRPHIDKPVASLSFTDPAALRRFLDAGRYMLGLMEGGPCGCADDTSDAPPNGPRRMQP